MSDAASPEAWGLLTSIDRAGRIGVYDFQPLRYRLSPGVAGGTQGWLIKIGKGKRETMNGRSDGRSEASDAQQR